MSPRRRAAPSTRPRALRSGLTVRTIEERGLALAKELARLTRGGDPPGLKLEGALEILFGAFGLADERFGRLLLEGWVWARRDKRVRLALAWFREQIRLSLEEILTEGVGSGAFRRELDPVVFSALCLGAAEGCLLESPGEGGTVAPAELVRTLLRLALSEA